MIEALVVSNGLLWLLVFVLGGVVLVLTRQIGLLHERIAPVGALVAQQGPKVGEPAPVIEAIDLAGRRVTVGGKGQRMLLFFLSPTCPVCETLLPTLQRVIRDESSDLQLVFASDGDTPEVHRAFVAERSLEAVPYLLSTELGMAFEVAKLPTAVLIDEGGIVRARGLVNSREHLESLFLADDMGVATLQEHLGKTRPKRPKRPGDAAVISLKDISLRRDDPK